QELPLALEHERHQLGIHAPARLRETHFPLAPVGGAGSPLYELQLLEMGNRTADPRLVHPSAPGNVLGSAAVAGSHGRHAPPLRNVQSEPLPVDVGEMIADPDREPIEAVGHETRQLEAELIRSPDAHRVIPDT